MKKKKPELTEAKAKVNVEAEVIKTFGDGQRIDDLMHLIKVYGIYFKGHIVITLWEMLFNINNTWRTEHFLDKGKIKGVREYHKGWALQDYDLGQLAEPVIQTLMLTDKIKLERGENGVDYLIAKSSL